MDQTRLFDITSSFHGGNKYSIAANESIVDQKQMLRAKVVMFIHNKGLSGATSDEVEKSLQLSHQTVSARLSEAKALKMVVDSGRKRKTRSGRAASVLVYMGLLV